ncbi:MAG: ATP-grasp domain-containing protein, partial [Planctomycetota bacterium]
MSKSLSITVLVDAATVPTEDPEFHHPEGKIITEYHVIEALRLLGHRVSELLQIPYTGTGTIGLMLCRDKRLCKQLLGLHKVHVPNFISIPWNRTIRIPKKIHYPLVIKPALADGSEGISNASLVSTEEALIERTTFIHERWQQDVIAEEYIEGRELYVTVVGNKRLKVFPARECLYDFDSDKGPSLATYRVKWNDKYREQWGIHFGFADLDEETEQ